MLGGNAGNEQGRSGSDGKRAVLSDGPVSPGGRCSSWPTKSPILPCSGNRQKGWDTWRSSQQGKRPERPLGDSVSARSCHGSLPRRWNSLFVALLLGAQLVSISTEIPRLKAVPASAQTTQCPMTAVRAGWLHSLALPCDGTVWAWGYNASGQLGLGHTGSSLTRAQVPGVNGAKGIAAGAEHSLAIGADDTAWAWGSNANGELGNGTTTDSPSPIRVQALTAVKGIAAGAEGAHSLAVTTDGAAWAWGDNSTGQLGNGTTNGSTTPVRVSGLGGVSAVAAGAEHSLALRTDGTVWGWGYNFYGQVGAPSAVCQNGSCSTQNRLTPVQVSGLSGVTAIAAGSQHSLALKSNGTVWAWGRNDEGQLGNGTTTSGSTPVQVSGLSGVVALAAGGYHSLALKSDGTAWAWGHNGQGQLGNGTTVSSRTPVQVSLTAVTAVAGGRNHSLAAQGNGALWAWGYNAYGQLGDGTRTNRSSPVEVRFSPPGPPVAVTATAGYRSASVSWSPPDTDGGTPVTGYNVAIFNSSSGARVNQATCGSDCRSMNFGDLSDFTSYYFTVSAMNSAGTGLSARSNVVTTSLLGPVFTTTTTTTTTATTTTTTSTTTTSTTAPPATTTTTAPTTTTTTTAPPQAGPPGAPTNVTATAGDAEATVTWTAPNSGGSTITGYTVTGAPGGTVQVGGTETTATVTGLTNGTEYTFTVVATNAYGDSPPSAPSNPVTPRPPPLYVAIGDSITTGFSEPDCKQNPEVSAHSCVGDPTTTPYPQLVQQRATGSLADLTLMRVGIWGYTLRQAREHDDNPASQPGDWEPQYHAVQRPNRLVTSTLGINDLEFSDVWHWFTVCTKVGVDPFDEENCRAHTRDHLVDMSRDLDRLFERLSGARSKGAEVVVTLYHNPYADRFLCSLTHRTADVIVSELNAELRARSDAAGLLVADVYSAFLGHGAGSGDEYVFGTKCDDVEGGLRGGVGKFLIPGKDFIEHDLRADYDPHPNGRGASAIADTIVGLLPS